MAIITYQDLATYMNRTFTSGEQAAANTMIGALERELSRILGRALAGAAINSEAHILKVNQRQIFLKEYPVISVTGLSIGTLGSEVAQTISDFDIHPWGIDGILATSTGTSALVTYTAGMSSSDQQQLEALMLRVSTREMSQILADAQGLERFRAEGVDMTFANKGMAGFTDDDLKWVRRYRRRGVY
jgi:hypothetical protein|tara:strand:- start:216 stop:776 length:561 start_codon:yes stop_codon:yes gene_type:complete